MWPGGGAQRSGAGGGSLSCAHLKRGTRHAPIALLVSLAFFFFFLLPAGQGHEDADGSSAFFFFFKLGRDTLFPSVSTVVFNHIVDRSSLIQRVNIKCTRGKEGQAIGKMAAMDGWMATGGWTDEWDSFAWCAGQI